MACSAIEDEAARSPRTWASERFAIRLGEPTDHDVPGGTQDAPMAAIRLRHMLEGGADRDWHDPVSTGLTLIDDLRLAQSRRIERALHAVDVVIPWSVLDEITDQIGAAPLDRIDAPSGVGLADRTIAHLIGAMLPVVWQRPKIAAHYVDHLGVALASHVAQTYGELRPAAHLTRGGLAPHILRRAQAMLRENLRSPQPLEDVAEACGFSARHFARAFRDSTGLTPHRWAMAARVAAAKTMMQSHAERLAEIALACGFADQSHLTRVFKRETGQSPAAWRRLHGGRRQRQEPAHPPRISPFGSNERPAVQVAGAWPA